MELKVKSVTFPEVIDFNFDEIKAEITEKVSMYKTLVYTEDQVKEAKADRANLNKFVKALSDERIAIKKQCLKPYEVFEAKVNELSKIVQEPITLIDAQVKEFEEKQKKEKQAKIESYKADAELLNAEKLQGISIPFNDKWLNSSVSFKSICDEINATIEKVVNDLATLSNLPEFGFEAVEVYKSTLDMNKAIYEAQRMSQIAKAKAEREAELERRKAEEELARQRAEEERNAREQEAENAVDDNLPGQMSFDDVSVTEPKAPAQQWINFSAFLSAQDAAALKEFFESRNILYKAI